MTFRDLVVNWNNGRKENAQRDFARKLGVTVASVSQWVNGHRTPKDTAKRQIADELGITIEELDKAFPARIPRQVRRYDPNNPPFLRSFNDPLAEANLQMVAVIGNAHAEAFTFRRDGIPEEFLPVFIPQGPAQRVFALKAVGKTVAADGEYLVVAEAQTADKGSMVLVRAGEKYAVGRLKKDAKPPEIILPSSGKTLRADEITGRILWILRKP